MHATEFNEKIDIRVFSSVCLVIIMIDTKLDTYTQQYV